VSEEKELTGNSEKTQAINETIEMAKVHFFSENAHEKHTAAITNAYAFFLGIFIVLFTFLIESAIPLYAFTIGATVLLGGTVYERFLVEKAFKRDLRKTSELIEQVKAGKELPPLERMLAH
jgi:hypothetical protein